MSVYEIKKQAETGGSVDLVWYLTRTCLSCLLVLLVIGVLSGCGNTEKPVDANVEISLGAVEPGAEPVVLHVGDRWRHVIEDVTIVVESLDAKTNYMGGGISINGSQKLHVTMENNHFVETIANNDDYRRVSGVQR